jgi:hypothetical protein
MNVSPTLENYSAVECKICYTLFKPWGGRMLDNVCQKCGYEADVELFSAGVHESESGCIRAYTDDDTFVCPRCPVANNSDQGAHYKF